MTQEEKAKRYDEAIERAKKWIAWLEKQGEQKVSYTTTVETGNGGINALVTREVPTNDEQKPAWSEEDEVKINRIMACLENLNVADNDILLKDVDWLKSLKQRIGG